MYRNENSEVPYSLLKVDFKRKSYIKQLNSKMKLQVGVNKQNFEYILTI